MRMRAYPPFAILRGTPTAVGTLASFDEVLEVWLEIAGRARWPSRPRDGLTLRHFGGRFLVRVPRSLRRDLSESAAQQDASLARLVVVVLTQAVVRHA